MKLFTLLTLALILQVAPAFSNGYQPSFAGTRNSSMGSLFSNKKFSAETLWLNPAAITGTESKYNLSAGINLSQSYAKFQHNSPSLYQASSDNNILLPFDIYISMALNQRFTVGFSFNTPFFGHIRWQEENWAGRFVLQELKKQVSVYQSSLAFSISDNFQIGAGLLIASSSMYFRKALPYRDANREGFFEISGKAVQYGLNAGIYYRLSEKLNLGLNFKSSLKFQNNRAPATFHVPASLHSFFAENTTANVSTATPALLDLTGSYIFSENIVFGAGVTLVVKNHADNYSFFFNQTNEYLPEVILTKKEQNGLIVRVGTEYDFSTILSARAGIIYHTSSAAVDYFYPDPLNLSRLTLTTGGSFWATTDLSVDLSFALSAGLEKNADYIPENFGGKYKLLLFIPGIGLNYAF